MPQPLNEANLTVSLLDHSDYSVECLSLFAKANEHQFSEHRSVQHSKHQQSKSALRQKHPYVLQAEEDKSEDGGLISVDRNSKATLPLTIPRPLQVVYKGSGAGKRRLGFNAGNTDELHSAVACQPNATRNRELSRAPLSLRLLRFPAARVSLLLAWILT